MKDRLMRVLPAALVLLGLGGLAVAFQVGQTDDAGGVASDPAIEELTPGQGDEVLRQTAVGIDLAPGYTAVLYINDIRIPEDQVNQLRDPDQPDNPGEAADFANALNRFRFTPGPGRVVEALAADQNCVRADYWPLADPTDVSSVTWCFTAA